MRGLLLTCAILTCTLQCFGRNRVDSINTKEEAVKFYGQYRSVSDCHGACYLFRMPNGDFYSDFNIDSFYKIDVDKNGSTDLIISGSGILAVVLDVVGAFEYHILAGGSEPIYNLKKIEDQVNPVMFILNDYSNKLLELHLKDTSRIDTLIYRSHALIEYNPHPTIGMIERIQYSMADCFVGDSCSGYNLIIDRNGNMQLITKIFGDSDRQYTSILKGEDYRELWSFLDYINIDAFKRHYIVPWSDPNGATTTFFYSNTRKDVEDDGRIGNFALRRLYELMNLLRSSKGWCRKFE